MQVTGAEVTLQMQTDGARPAELTGIDLKKTYEDKATFYFYHHGW